MIGKRPMKNQTDAIGKKLRDFRDSVLIYFSEEDDSWIAHSLRTDQIGLGDDVVTALSNLIRAIDSLIELCKEDRTLALFRDAPADVKKRARAAKPLRRELYEIAHLKARGKWPDDQPLKVEPEEDEAFIAKIAEHIS